MIMRYIKIFILIFFIQTNFSVADCDLEDYWKPIPAYSFNCNFSVSGMTYDPIINGDEGTRSKMADCYMKRNESYNFDFILKTPIEDGETTQIYWELNRINPLLDAKAVLIFIDHKGNDTTIVIEELASKIGISRDEYFGEFKIGSSPVTKTFSIHNLSKRNLLVTDLRLKRNNQKFKILPLDWKLNKEFKAGEVREFKVAFTPDTIFNNYNNLFKDTIGAGDSCSFEYLAEIKANYAFPKLILHDVDFGELSLPTTYTTRLRLTNSSDVDLAIDSAKGPLLNEFELILPFQNIKKLSEITPYNRLILKAKTIYDFDIRYTAKSSGTFLDYITLYTNAEHQRIDIKLLAIVKDSIANSVFDEMTSKIQITYTEKTILIANSNEEELNYRIVDLNGKLITSGLLKASTEINLKDNPAQAVLLGIINSKAETVMNRKVILK